VNVGDILQVIWVSIAAAVGITTAYALTVLGSARLAEARRAGRAGAVVGYAALTALCLAIFAAVVVVGVNIMLTSKS
jgi:hypothetical protein